MFEIELTEPKYSPCPCCNGRMTNLTRFVSRDGDAFAIYHATLAEEHPELGAHLAIGIDDDWSMPESSSRVAFACWILLAENELRVSVTNKAESPWSESKVLGRMLDRDEALANPLIDEVFHLTDHIVEQDPVIRELFAGESIH